MCRTVSDNIQNRADFKALVNGLIFSTNVVFGVASTVSGEALGPGPFATCEAAPFAEMLTHYTSYQA
jgi:hypothetical protein